MELTAVYMFNLVPVLVAGHDSGYDQHGAGDVHLQGHPVQHPRVHLADPRLAVQWPSLDLCPAPHAEIQARPEQSSGHCLLCPALDAPLSITYFCRL